MADEFDQYKAKPQGDEFDQYKVTPPPASPGTGQQIMQGAKDVGMGVLRGAGHTANAIGSMLLPDRLLKTVGVTPPSEEQKANSFAPRNTAEKVGYGLEQGAEFLAPIGAEEKAASLLPKGLQAAGRIGGQSLTAGAINKLQGGDFKTGAIAGGVGGGIGEAGRAVAPALARTALGIRTNELLHGAKPGEAVLAETRGVRPGTIAQQAGAKISQLTPALEHEAQAVPTSLTAGFHAKNLDPALSVVDDAIAKARQRNSPVIGDLKQLRSQLTHSVETGQPLPPPTDMGDIINLRRGVNDTISNWTREAKGEGKTARGVYGALTGEVHRAAPATEELDQRISSLIPAMKHAEFTEHAPGIASRSMNRIARPTGALVGSGVLGYEGYRQGGIPGALAGATMGVLIPEAISSPTGQMIVARGLHSGIPARTLAPATLRMMQLEEEGKQ